MSLHRYQDIDWSRLWQQAQAERSWQPKGVADWDERAASFARRTGQSAYADAFLALLKPEPDWSVLDVGSGPGTLALPLAAKVRTVTCIDFSPKMLAILADRAERNRLDNIATLPLSWDDDWRACGLLSHDLVIASRSLAVADLGAALRRLNEFAAHRVAVTDRVGAGPHDPDAFAAVGRPLHPGPDYIFTVNILYEMGCLATVDFIRLEETARYRNLEQALARYHWMLPELDTRETKRLQAYIRSIARNCDDGSIALHPRHVPTWAYITWHPDRKRS
ncbi:class I SAM-dependent methyltransferase [Desulfobulbus sp.]|uniref:class I SAM-dependent methyltransferase n=1 Tax=Desulfobulbus sp. TaxID=895 RepID=UPI00286EBECE|nr:class I SAM-dependent methyltransferase [Desulfobulbus sp.]